MLGESLVAEAHEQGIEKLVVGAVIHANGHALAVTRSLEDDFLPGIEELPSGGVEAGETLVEALNRELREEVGFPAEEIDDGFLGVFDYRSGSGRAARQFTVSVPLGDNEVRLSEEHTAHRWLASDELAAVSATTETRIVLADWFRWAVARPASRSAR